MNTDSSGSRCSRETKVAKIGKRQSIWGKSSSLSELKVYEGRGEIQEEKER